MRLSALIFTLSVLLQLSATQRTDSLMSELKRALEQRDVFASQKLEKINNFHLEADSAVTTYFRRTSYAISGSDVKFIAALYSAIDVKHGLQSSITFGKIFVVTVNFPYSS